MRSSSITAIFSSSPIRERDGSDESSPAASSPIKPAYRSRPSLGTSHAASQLSKTDPFAGLKELDAAPSQVNKASYVLFGSFTHALLLGRSKPTGQPHASSASNTPEADDSVPQASPGVGTKPTQHIPLPNHARHVSRRHAIIEWLPFSPLPRAVDSRAKKTPSGGFVVRILGQNGLIVDGKRRREGHVLRLEPGKSTIDFFGVKTIFEIHPDASRPMHAVTSKAKKAARASLPGADGSSPAKRPASDSIRRSASMRQLEQSQDASQEAVSQLLGAALSSQSRFVKTSNAQGAPLSPPSSSPAPFATSSPAGPSADRDGEDDAEEPLSPSLGRGRSDLELSMPPLSLGLSSVGTPSSAAPAVPPAVERENADAGNTTIPSEVENEAATRAAKQPRTELEAAPVDGAESDLTPSPELAPRGLPSSSEASAAPAMSNTPKPAAQAASQGPFASRARTLKPTTSQIMMPPPKVPASATATGSAAARGPSSGSSSPALSAGAGPDSQQFRNALRDQARACVAILAPTYDLEGLLAGAIVFHRTATISASEAVRSVLASTQGLMRGEVGGSATAADLAQGSIVPGWGAAQLLSSLPASTATERWTSTARRAWTERLESVLQSKPMFGQIHRAGKDASGHSLEHWYYYDAAGDEDRERAANLGSLAKPIRGALKTHKPIFWKKGAFPKSADEEVGVATSSATTETSSTVAPSSSSSSWLLKDGPMGDSQIGPAFPSTPTVTASASTGSMPSSSSSSAKRPMLDERRIWEETQPEERESTWDKEGDMDWSGRSGGGSMGSGVGASSGKRRRK